MKKLILILAILLCINVCAASENVINLAKEPNIIAIYKSSSQRAKDYVSYFFIAALVILGIIEAKNAIYNKSNY